MRKILKRNPETVKIVGLAKPKGIFTILFLVTGFLSLILFLIRVIPKPSRATYPCMKATMPIAYSFIAYILTLSGSALFFRKAFVKAREKHLTYVAVFLLLGGLSVTWALVNNPSSAGANTVAIQEFNDPLGPNAPVGVAKGVQHGRVVWMWNPAATNENCTNGNHSDAYWQSKNTDQDVVDQMFSDGLKELTDDDTDAAAWDAIFKYFNTNHDKGEVGYTSGETVFIKINAVTAWSGAAPNGVMPSNKAIEYDTSPQTIMTMLRQLVNVAGVPQENIYIGDPMADIWNNIYNYLFAEFPNVNYTSKRTITGRYKLTANTDPGIIFSDKGTVMDNVTQYSFFEEFMNADYLLNIPTMKGHRWGGVTLFAKNHFGSHTFDYSWDMHKGLMNPDENGMRYGYGLYRVFVDLMGNQYLGGNTLLYFMEGLWATSYEHQKPQKFLSAPFNNDWASSLLLSLDPVAIESVCLDILQKEFTMATEDIIDGYDGPAIDRFTFVQWDGVDDYLHQAASSDYWPAGISYDPDNSGTPISSLGTHEHWNNTTDMQYSRNLGSGEGIELVKIFSEVEALNNIISGTSINLFPNPSQGEVNLSLNLSSAALVTISLYTLNGQLVENISSESRAAGFNEIEFDMSHLQSGVYFCVVEADNSLEVSRITEKISIQ